jgi:hypothetical protein
MTTVWVTIAVLAAGTIAIRAAGPVAVGGRALPARAADVIVLLAPALLAALVVVETFGEDGGNLSIDARAAGLVVAAAALALRAPVVVVVFAAAVATALLRALA